MNEYQGREKTHRAVLGELEAEENHDNGHRDARVERSGKHVYAKSVSD
jgi:hypothetical protein